jgi:multiple sugar transport system permease protein
MGILRIARYVALYVLLCALAVIMVFPFAWMVSTSFKTDADALQYPPKFIPDPITPHAYSNLFKVMPFGLFYFNSTKITVLVLVGQVFVASLAGYAFAKLRFVGSGVCFAIVLGSMMVPAMINIIPLYLMFKTFGWLNSHYPLILPRILQASFGTFLMRQFYMTVPADLDAAARIDGCNGFAIYWRIMMPLSKPVLASLAIFVFMWTWNAFIDSLIYINSQSKMTVTLGLSALRSETDARWPTLMAGALLSILPIVITYFFAQKHFVQGITFTGIKG